MIRFPPRQILVGFDRSALSVAAWRHAVALAKRCGAVLEVAYVEPWVPVAGGAGGGLYVPPELSAGQAKALRAEIRAVVGDGPKIAIVQGDPAACLLRLARSRRADMIVVGTHGRRGLSRVLLGSVAEELLRSSPVPVLVARGPAREIKAVLAPVHFTSYSNYGFACADAFAGGLGARLTALHVDVDPVWGGNAQMRLRRLVAPLTGEARVRCEALVVRDEDPCRGILRASAQHDLIVLVAHKNGALQDALFGMTAQKVLRGSRKPLLVVPPPRLARAVASRRGKLPRRRLCGRAEGPR